MRPVAGDHHRPRQLFTLRLLAGSLGEPADKLGAMIQHAQTA
jgi:hypothetical protein